MNHGTRLPVTEIPGLRASTVHDFKSRIGVLAALGLTRLMSDLLFGVKPTDPLTFAFVALTLCATALLACYIPARRAMSIDPVVALREE